MSKRVMLGFIIITWLIMAGEECFGEPFLIRGTRPLAMGGAFVAVAEDAIAAHWNPAGLAKQQKGFDGEIHFYLDTSGTGDIVKELDNIRKIEYEDIKNAAERRKYDSDPINPKYVKNFFRLLEGLGNLNKEGLGIILNAGGGVNIRARNWGVSAIDYAMASGDPFIDLNNISLGKSGSDTVATVRDDIYSRVGTGIDYTPGVDNWTQEAEDFAEYLYSIKILDSDTLVFDSQSQAEALMKMALDAGLDIGKAKEYTELVANVASKLIATDATNTTRSLENNKSTLVAKGCFMQEFTLTHARAFQNLYLGANLKYMRAKMAWYSPQVFKEDVEKEVKDIKDRDTKDSSAFGIDLGVLYDVNKKLTTGLVIKNINSPAFDYPDEANLPRYQIKPQIRAGVCYKPWRGMTLAADLDITKNKTILDGFDSRLLSTGFEWWWFNFLVLRGGLLKNLDNSSIGTVYTGGLGVNLLGLHIESSGMISSKKTQVEGGDKVPTEIGSSIQISLNF